MSIVVEAIIPVLVESLVKNAISLVSNLRVFGSKRDHFVADLNEWKSILDYSRGFLHDAEQKKLSNSAVSSWLEELEAWIYDAEDIIGVLNYDTLKRQVELSKTSPGGLLCLNIWNSPETSTASFWTNSIMTRKFDEVTERLHRLKQNLMFLNLFEQPVTSYYRIVQSRPQSVSLPCEPAVFGRENNKQEIIRFILKKEEDKRIGVIPIVGMGGLGKTTLARYVYNDPKVVCFFDVRIWVCVSSDYDIKKISKEILESVSQNCSNAKDKSLEWIHLKLREEVRNKKFLLVLDDNWNENYADWNLLQPIFSEASRGSKIILTTRSQRVADMVRTVPCIIPSQLSDDDCWLLLRTHADLDLSIASYARLEAIGKEIAMKCSGLPLAAMVVGGLLRNKTRVEEWNRILNSESWIARNGDGNVMSVLMMSYEDLGPQLKRCFGFFSFFPEDYLFLEDEIVLIWVGAGLIQLAGEGESEEEVGHQYFQLLLSKSLLVFSHTTYDHKPYYVMHDLVLKLAQEVSRRSRYITKDDRLETHISLESRRHLFFDISRFENVVEILSKDSKSTLPLRTFFALGEKWRQVRLKRDDFFCSLKYLRALSLPGLINSQLPDPIGRMKLLRYLDISRSHICRLPNFIASLYNLEILILNYCPHLTNLPEKIGQLNNLFYLDIKNCGKLKQLPGGIKDLGGLRKLSNFIIGGNLFLSSLGNLEHLQGSLEISCLRNVRSPDEARSAHLSSKELKSLTYQWNLSVYDGLGDDNLVNIEGEDDILEQLRPNENLEILRIYDFGGSRLPGWLPASLLYLNVLELHKCRNCTILDCTWTSLAKLYVNRCPNMTIYLHRMPGLKELSVFDCKMIDWAESFSFNSLESLTVSRCLSQRVVLSFGDFPPSLISIQIDHCTELTSFSQLGSLPIGLKTIKFWGCPRLVCKLPEALRNCLSLESLLLCSCSYEVITEVLRLQLPHLKDLSLASCKCMSAFTAEDTEILRIPRLLSKLPETLHNCSSLERLVLGSCNYKVLKELLTLQLPNLKELSLANCNGMVAFPAEDTEMKMVRLTYSVEKLSISSFPELKQISSETFGSLSTLSIYNCEALDSFVDDLPPSMEKLLIENCPVLAKKLQDHDHTLCSKISHISNVELYCNVIYG